MPDPGVTNGDSSSVTFVLVMHSSETGDPVVSSRIVTTTGEAVGVFVGLLVGEAVGELVGAEVGLLVGELVGELVGAAVVGL